MIEKNGELTENSVGDFAFGKKSEYYDKQGSAVADGANKHMLKEPVKISKKNLTNSDSSVE